MANLSSSSHIESFSTTQPPLFTRTDYSYWKTKMIRFFQSTNLDLWDAIEDNPHIPSITWYIFEIKILKCGILLEGLFKSEISLEVCKGCLEPKVQDGGLESLIFIFFFKKDHHPIHLPLG